MDFRRALPALWLFVCAAPLVALAKPDVSLHLSAYLIAQSPGHTSETPLGSKPVTAGARVRFVIQAHNGGSSPALHLTPSDRIPAHMAYVPGSATGGYATVQFTVDGKTWSAHPLVAVRTAKGTMHRPADPSQYKAVRWVTHVALPANHTFTYSYVAQVSAPQKAAK
jgi:uncharacterized repeat protein (TIGR01451 family)